MTLLTADEAFVLAVEKHQKGDFFGAKQLYQNILEVLPSHFQSLGNLGTLEVQFGKPEKAKVLFLKALEINPKFADADYNLGVIFQESGIEKQAIYHYRKALKSKSNSEGICYNLANLYREMGRFRQAKQFYQRAIDLNPDFANAHFNLGLSLLSREHFDQGFHHYEWRKKLASFMPYAAKVKDSSTEWKGQNLKGKKILIIAEQGIGDTIQFSRYILFILDMKPKDVLFQVDGKLAHFFKEEKITLVSEEATSPLYHFHVFLMSLPGLFFKATGKLYGQVNFLSRNVQMKLKWEKKLKDLQGIKVGLNWQGSELHKNDQDRSIPLSDFGGLFDTQDVNFINLQRGYGFEQIEVFKYKDRLLSFDWEKDIENEENAFEDAIGMLEQLDLVITCCSALAHVSSTLGIKTWVLVSKNPDWRWFLRKKKTQWYKNTKLFRQRKRGDWIEVVASVKQELGLEFKVS